MHQYIVHYKKKKVFISVNDKQEIIPTVLKKISAETTNVDDWCLEVYHDTLKSYYSVEDSSEIPDEGILQLVSSIDATEGIA